MRIEPAGSLPVLCKKKTGSQGRLVIVNLQVGAKDAEADLIIRARVDEVLTAIMSMNYGLTLPEGETEWVESKMAGTSPSGSLK